MEPQSICVPPTVATFVVVWSALLLTAGCARNDGAASGGPIPLEGICDVYLDDLCTALVQCTDSVYASVDECRADHRCAGFRELKEEIVGGWTEYSPEGAGRCHAQLRADPCAFAKRYTFEPSLPLVLIDCGGAVTGKHAVGAICIGDQSCVPGSFCVPHDTCQGTCTRFLQVGEGPCLFSLDVRCDPALECFADACRVRSTKPGDRCVASSECNAADLWCDATLVCARRHGEGEPCTLSALECLAGLHCDADANSAGVCRPPASVGGRCLDIEDCAAGTTCARPNAGALLGTCAPLSGEGAACSTSRDCVDGIECLSGTCRRQRHLGDRCDALSMCVVGNCREGTCVPRGSAGASCTSTSDCLSRGCEQGACKDPMPCWDFLKASGAI